MWRSYFDPGSHIYGIDIRPECKRFEDERTTIVIGDQGDRTFWKSFKSGCEGLDIVIDDGGHSPEQQRITLEEMLPFIRPGGVYICEDVRGSFDRFASFATGLVDELNRTVATPEHRHCGPRSSFQNSIHSIHFYPFVVVIEKHQTSSIDFPAPKRGTEWPA